MSTHTSKTKETVYSAYMNIHTAWQTGASSSDIYHMILMWIEIWKPEVVHPEIADLIHDYIQRCESGDSTYDLVEDFIYKSRYASLREAFMKE